MPIESKILTQPMLEPFQALVQGIITKKVRMDSMINVMDVTNTERIRI